jgi:hypothetical protein
MCHTASLASFPLKRRSWLRGALLAPLAGSALPVLAMAAELTLNFRGTSWLHRWSSRGLHEFTPAADADLARWQDMLTLNVHDQVQRGEQLADVANTVLGNYQRHGKVLQTRSTPRTPDRPAQHFIAAVLGTREFLEAAFARCLMHEGTGVVAVVSHRVYGSAAGPAMSTWLGAHGQLVDEALMGWAQLPGLDSLKRLPARPAR